MPKPPAMLVDLVNNTVKEVRTLSKTVVQLYETFQTVEKGSSVLYEFVMKEKIRLDEVYERVKKLEDEKDNPR
jgi:ACT domain-containing protein